MPVWMRAGRLTRPSWARAADDEWEIAEASHGRVPAVSCIADLRGRVERAASLLSDVGNVYQLAHLLTGAAYAALCLGGDENPDRDLRFGGRIRLEFKAGEGSRATAAAASRWPGSR
jgi:hypothetical protein